MKNRTLILALMAAAMLAMPHSDALAAAKKKKQQPAQTEQTADDKEKKEAGRKYDKLLKNAVSAKGDFITLHNVEGKKIYMEYPLKYLGRRILVGGTLSAVSNPAHLNVGYKHSAPIHLQVDRRDSTLLLNRPNTSATLNSSDPGLQKAFERNFIPKLYKACPILAYNRDSSAVVVDVTSLVQDMGPQGEKGKNKEKSTFGTVKSFADNASVEMFQEVSIEQTVLILKINLGEVSTVSNVSILLLPEEPMRPRIQDSRIGVFSTRDANSTGVTPKYSLSSAGDGLRPYFLANRWRIEPVDTEAWQRGETVEVRKPIVWYVDDAFPEEWRQPIHEGVLMWNRAFERIGLKNVMQVRDFPSKEEEPEFDPDNLKYSCLRYSPSATMNAMGPSWVDPVTGEIINASVIVYNDVIRLINNWRFVQTSQVDERVRARKMPREIVDESMVYVISHEIGHTLGLMHNMSASASIPVDSLRSASFTRKFGTTTSIMDYARFNYVAQPDDKGVKLTPPDLGVYDEYAIEWLYKPVPEARDMWEEAAIAGRLIDRKAGDPVYRYGRQQISSGKADVTYDPSSMSEDLGDDPVKAGNYGISNLKYILPNISRWIAGDDDFSHRQGLYSQISTQYYRYLTNVMYQIGGIYLYDVKDGTAGSPAVAVERKRQKESLSWLISQLRGCGWINYPELTSRFALHTDVSASLCSMIAAHLTTTIPDHVTLSSHVAASDPYTIREYYDDLYNEAFRTTIGGGRLTAEEKLLQRLLVEACAEPMIVARNAQKLTSEMPLLTDYSSLPSYEELLFGGRIGSQIVSQYGEELEALEKRFGKGAVASALMTEDDCCGAWSSFGESRAPFQSAVKTANISEIEPYSQAMTARIHTLMSSRRHSAPAEDRAHYEYLWRLTHNAVKE